MSKPLKKESGTVPSASDNSAVTAPGSDTPLRFVTAASLFDGHDAAINIMRRLIQAQGCEVIHLGHNRSVLDIVRAAIQEDADAIAVSSYQGGHNEFFRFMIDQLKERGAGHIQVFAGGGGTITLDEIKELQAYGVNRIYHPDDGMHMGLVEMIHDVVERAAEHRQQPVFPSSLRKDNANDVAHMLTALEAGLFGDAELKMKRHEWAGVKKQAPVIGITGTGGAGKSSVTDELLNRLLTSFPDKRIAVLAVDPTRRRTGGALLGDRIRMNSLRSERIYMRSMATRRQHMATSAMLQDAIHFLKSAGFDLVIVETAGIGQSDSEIVDMVDLSCYVMTSDFGAQSQLEKIDMLDFAELVILNKFDRRAAEDALRDIRKQWKRNHLAFTMDDDDVPVYPTIASQFNDPGISWMFVNLLRLLRDKLGLSESEWTADIDTSVRTPKSTVLIPGSRVRYLAEIAEQGRDINKDIERQAQAASLAQSYYDCLKDMGDPVLPAAFDSYPTDALLGSENLRNVVNPAPSTGGAAAEQDDELRQREADSLRLLRQRYNAAIQELSAEAIKLLKEWPARKEGIRTEQYAYEVRGREITGSNYRESLSRLQIPK
ncbi:MAG: cobalamin-dependent protein, partial [Lysobacterales bacterium]